MPLTNENPERVAQAAAWSPVLAGRVPGGCERPCPTLPSPGPRRREPRPGRRCPAPNSRPSDGETPGDGPVSLGCGDTGWGPWELVRGEAAPHAAPWLATAWACGSHGRPATHPVFVNTALGCRAQPLSAAKTVAPVPASGPGSPFPPKANRHCLGKVGINAPQEDSSAAHPEHKCRQGHHLFLINLFTKSETVEVWGLYTGTGLGGSVHGAGRRDLHVEGCFRIKKIMGATTTPSPSPLKRHKNRRL